MRLEKLRQADLNLLITFAAIAEERSITAAAARLLLSQPAVSRALQRARALFADELLIRSPHGFELTLRGRQILEELHALLPRVDSLLSPAHFDPAGEPSRFRVSGPDNVLTALFPALVREYARPPYHVYFELHPWQPAAADLLEHGQLDLLLHIDDGLLPSHFQSERLYREDWLCAVAQDAPYPAGRLTLPEYLAAPHITVGTLAGLQTIPDKQLAVLGHRRHSALRLPYFNVALRCLPGTDLIVTLTSGMAPALRADPSIRLLAAPPELQPFHFLMAWHPRLGADPRHQWLRTALRTAAAAVPTAEPTA